MKDISYNLKTSTVKNNNLKIKESHKFFKFINTKYPFLGITSKNFMAKTVKIQISRVF
jgi:hypothetical protein